MAVTSDHVELGRMRKHRVQVWALEEREADEPGHKGWRKKRVRGLLMYHYSALAWNLEIRQPRWIQLPGVQVINLFLSLQTNMCTHVSMAVQGVEQKLGGNEGRQESLNGSRNSMECP